MSSKKDKPLKIVTPDFQEEKDAPVPNVAFHLTRMFSQLQIAQLQPMDMLVLTLRDNMAPVTKQNICDKLTSLTEHMQCRVLVLNPGDVLHVVRSAINEQEAQKTRIQAIVYAMEWAEEDGVFTCVHPGTPVQGTGPDKAAAVQDFFQKAREHAAQPPAA